MKHLHVTETDTTYHFTISKNRLFIAVGMLNVKCDLVDLVFNDEKFIVSDCNSIDLLLEPEHYQSLKDAIVGDYKANALFQSDASSESEADQYLDKE